ncbi:MAG: glucose-1-phosphate cytidylyltransferase [Chloroflexota bacterium]
MKVAILAGGFGTRLQEETTIKPKPMVEIGGEPVLWHIMKYYASFGHTEFLVALGYKGEVVKNYFLNYRYLRNNLVMRLANGRIECQDGCCEDWLVHLIDTGLRTETGGRLKRLARWIGNDTFMLTYGDGVASIDLDKLLAFHRNHGKLATVTAVRPPARFGSMKFDGDYVHHFEEKPQIGEGWINGGFFVLEPAALDYIEGDSTLWEHGPLERLAREGQLVAYRHEGFWQCMDTLRDVRLLETMWSQGQAPWKVWD